MVLIATLSVSLVANSGRSTWFQGVLLSAVYLLFAITLFTLPPKAQ
jgi:Ca2+:H+ antiporter